MSHKKFEFEIMHFFDFYNCKILTKKVTNQIFQSLYDLISILATLQSMMSGAKTEDEEIMMKNLAKTFPMLSHLTSTPTQLNNAAAEDDAKPDMKHLFQTMGLDLVKQFTEMQQKRQRDEDVSEAAPEAKKAKEESLKVNGGDESPNRDETNTPASEHDSKEPRNLGEMQEMLQRAMMGAQLQQMNPLMMQMAQLQGLNPLITMNLYPPLIPPNLLKQGGAGNDPLAQLQANHPLLGASGLDPKLLALMSAARQGGAAAAAASAESPQPPKNLAQIMGLLNQAPPMPPISQSESGKPVFPAGFPAPPPNFPLPRPEAPGGLMLPQQPVMQEGKRARTRISDDQLKILRANFDINNSPTEETLNKMSQQTGLPLKVIKHWFRNTLFKERQKNKDSPYNFNNPPSTKLNLEEYEKTGEPKVTPLNPSDQEEYIRQEAAKKECSTDNKDSNHKREGSVEKSEPINASPKLVPTTPTSVNETNSSSVPVSMAEAGLTLSRLLGTPLTPGVFGGPGGQPPPPLLPNFPAFPMTTIPNSISGSLPTTPPLPDYLNSLARSNPLNRPQSPQSVGSGQGKRANRTRFTDYQIKVLQEFFENNAYPKDDDLEYLSKLLGLSPRVIVVWFQNARQKARKIYENQPPAEAQEGDEASGRFTRTSGCNYQCKKCLLVFQRYYELIRHQKQHCYKEEDARRSAQAQKAAAQAAAQFVGPPPPLIPHSEESRSSNGGDERSLTSPAINDQEQDHPRTSILNFPPHTPFGILQQQALQQQQQLPLPQLPQQPPPQPQNLLQQQLQSSQHQQPDSGDDLFDESESLASSPSSKRKLSEDGDLDEETLQHREKRLRTTILPEQLDFLYQKYQVESNPSRKMLEQIASEVGLRKRVVQVWFQNTRARERKGQFRVNGQSPQHICKKCPFCSAIFKVRTALEAHLATKHPDQPTGIVDIDALPNIESASEDGDHPQQPQEIHSPDSGTPLIPTTTSSIGVSDFQNSMRKYYEDTMKRFMSDLADQKQHYPNESQSPNHLTLNHHQALDLTAGFNNIDNDTGSDIHGDGDSDQNNRSLESNGGSKRFRTQMSGVQVKMMKAIFEAYKTPTMTECSTLGREIGLQKRVVQVWFQNARAKEKRARLQLQQATGREPEPPLPPEQCVVCPGVTFGQRFAVQDHLFTKNHLEHLRLALEQGRYDPESPGTAMAQAAAALGQQNGGAPPPLGGGSPNAGEQPALSMLQMTTQVNNSHELLDIPNRPNPRMLMQV